MKDSHISWTDHTFNPWWGCTEVSPGCDNCYAREIAKRFGRATWGKGEPRVLASEASWRKPLQWDAEAKELGIRYRVFCLSMADPFDPEVPGEWRARMFELWEATPNLDWLPLTKRPQNVLKMVPAAWLEPGGWPSNVAMGTSVESQEYVWRIDKLLAIPGEIPMFFVSGEPLLGALDLDIYHGDFGTHLLTGLDAEYPEEGVGRRVDWVLIGLESGPKRRPGSNEHAYDLMRQCQAAGVAVWMKQGSGMRSEVPFNDARLDGVRELPRWRR